MTICFSRLFLIFFLLCQYNDELPLESNSAIDQVSSFREIDADKKRSSTFILPPTCVILLSFPYNYSFSLSSNIYIHTMSKHKERKTSCGHISANLTTILESLFIR